MTREEAIEIIGCYDINFYDLSGEKIPADKLGEAFDMAIEALSGDDNWIPVKKHGMPHNEGLYIVTLRNWYGAGRCAFYDDVEILPYGREGWDKATAWMPFPEPYRESEVEE